jgi:hypothetical protein
LGTFFALARPRATTAADPPAIREARRSDNLVLVRPEFHNAFTREGDERFMRRFVLITLAVGLLVVGTAAQAGAAPPDDPPGPVSRFTEPFGVAFEDPADQLVALGGPPAELGCFGLGFEDNLAEFQIVELPSGPVKVLVRDDDMPIFLYAASSIDELCEAVDGGVIPEPIATGTVRVVLNDNDADVSLTRTNAFGYTAKGTLERTDGTACAFSATFRALITQEDEFRVLVADIRSNC